MSAVEIALRKELNEVNSKLSEYVNRYTELAKTVNNQQSAPPMMVPTPPTGPPAPVETPVQEQIRSILAGLEGLKDSTQRIKGGLDFAFRRINENSYAIDAGRQYGMINDLIIKKLPLDSLPNCPEKRHGFQFTNFLVEELNKRMPNLEPKLRPEHISIAHELPSKYSTSVIIRFAIRNMRNQIFYSKSQLKDDPDGVMISEHLTQYNRELLNEAAVFVGNYKKAFSKECKIYMNYKGQRVHLLSKEHLHHIRINGLPNKNIFARNRLQHTAQNNNSVVPPQINNNNYPASNTYEEQMDPANSGQVLRGGQYYQQIPPQAGDNFASTQ